MALTSGKGCGLEEVLSDPRLLPPERVRGSAGDGSEGQKGPRVCSASADCSAKRQAEGPLLEGELPLHLADTWQWPAPEPRAGHTQVTSQATWRGRASVAMPWGA